MARVRAIRLGALFSVLFVAAAVTGFACVGQDATPGAAASADASVGADGSPNPTGTDGGPGSPDGAVDAGQDAQPESFDPRKLQNLRLWLEGSKGVTKEAVGNTITAWRDSSERWADAGADPNRPDGGVHVAVQGGAGTPPAITLNGIAGRPSIGFAAAGGRLEIANHSDFHLGTGDFVVALVAKITGGSGALWDLTGATIPRAGFVVQLGRTCWLLGAQGGDKCTAPTATLSPDPHVVVGRRKAGQMQFRVDAVTVGTYDVTVDDPNLTQIFRALYIGGGPEMLTAEVVHLVGPTPDENLQQLESYLKGKYQIP